MASLGVNVNVPCCMLPRPIGMFRRGYPAPGSLCPSIRDGCRRVVDTSKSMGPGVSLELHRRTHVGSRERLGLIRVCCRACDQG